jgi:hypothetical protein
MNNTITVTLNEFAELVDASVSALVVGGEDLDSAIEAVNSVLDKFSEDINNMNFVSVSQLLLLKFICPMCDETLE